MERLTLEERAAFVELASALLAQREKLEFYREQEVAVKGGQAGKVMVQRPDVAEAIALSRQLYHLLLQLKRRCPQTTAFRFRRHLIVLTEPQGQPIGMHVIPERGIESIED